MATPSGNNNPVPITGINVIDGLVQGSQWTFGGGQRVLTYSLDYSGTPVSTWTQPRIDAVNQIFQSYSNVINVQFQFLGVGSQGLNGQGLSSQAASNADISIALTGNAIGSNFLSLGAFPDLTFIHLVRPLLPSYGAMPDTKIAGDIFLNDTQSDFSSYFYAGGIGFEDTVHEVGHALGLKHPHDDGGASLIPGQTPRPLLATGNDTSHTVMSYNESSSGPASGNVTTPMPYDILALQQIYGANNTYHTGNDTYSVTSTSLATIWDAGGIDVIDASTAGGATYIDLRPGSVRPGTPGNFQHGPAWGSPQFNYGYSVAYNVTIENATGSNFGDTIFGNSGVNVIDGGNGGDTIDGLGGDDIIQGGLSDDSIRITRGGGLDTIYDTGGAHDTLGVVATPQTVKLVRNGDDLYVMITGTRDGAYLPSYFTLSDKPMEQITFTGANDWNGIVWDTNTIAANTVLNVAPVINAPSVKNTTQGTWTELSTFVTTSDANGDAMTFEVRDATNTAGSGLLYGNGVFQPQGATVTANGSLSGVWVQGGTNLGHDNIEIRAFDGYQWTNWTDIDLNTRLPNRAPVVVSNGVGVVVGSPVQASTLFTVNDADGDTMTQYHFYDAGAGAGSGHFTINNVQQSALTILTVNDLSTVGYTPGQNNGSETLYVQAYDGEAWSGWTSWSEQTLRATNVAPVINAPSVKNTTQGTWTQLSTFVTTTDADGDPMVRFEVRDATNTAGSGLLYGNGVFQPQGATVLVNGSDLSAVYVQGGANQGHDTIQVRTDDGYGWTNWTDIDLNTRLPNRAPVVVSNGVGVVVGSPVQASTLFTVNDADGDTMTQYHFYDAGAGAGSGHFTINNVQQSALTILTVNDLSTVGYTPGQNNGSETLYVQAYDGEAWSGWTSWSEQTLRATNVAPVINAPSVKNTTQGTWTQLSTFVTTTDADGDPMVRFEVRDATNTAGSGLLYGNGVFQPQGATVLVNGSDLSAVYVQGGANQGHDTIQVRTDDGYGWTNWTDIDLNTRLPNRAPVVVSNGVGVVVGSPVQASTLFTVNDADGDTMTQYHFYDAGAGAGSGHFTINNVQQSALTILTVNDLSTVGYTPGQNNGSETLYVQAYDGEAWSGWTSWSEQTLRATNVAPVINAPSVKNTTQGTWTQLSTFVTTTDADGDPMVRFEVRDATNTAGSGLLYGNGVFQPQGATVLVNGSDLSAVYVQGGANQGHDTIQVRTDDGYGWTNWTDIDLNTRLPNRAPVVVSNGVGVVVGSPVQASTLFTVNDADGDTMTQYHFYDAGAGAGSGHFTINNVQQSALTILTVNDLSTVGYTPGQNNGSETLYVQAYDGEAWSGWTSWSEQTLRATNVAPVINAPSVKNTTQGTWTQLSTFVTTTDADGDPMVRFEVRDATNTAGSGLLYGNGVFQPQGATVLVNGSDLSTVYVQGGANQGHDTIQVRTDDGYGWTNWTDIDLNTRLFNIPPMVQPTAATQGVAIGSSVQVSTLFEASDGNADTIQQYHFYDAGAGGGYFRINGVQQAAFTQLTVNTADLGNTVYVAGGSQGTETLYVQVFDGEAWSGWTSWSEQSLPNASSSRFAEAIGTPATDAFGANSITPNHVVFGLNGNDQLTASNPTSDQILNHMFMGGPLPVYERVPATEFAPLLIGGQGGDTYTVRSGSAAMVLENGNSANDTLEFTDFSYGFNGRVEWFAYTIDGGRDLVLSNYLTRTGVILFDWQMPENRIESFILGSGTYTYDQMVTALYNRGFGDIPWEDVGEDTVKMHEMIDFYGQRSTSLSAPANALPTFTGGTRNVALNSGVIYGQDITNPSDADGDAITQFRIMDGTADANSGFLILNGQVLTPQQVYTFNASDMTNLFFNGGSALTTDQVSMQGFDGHAWGQWWSWGINTVAPPADPGGNDYADAQFVTLSSTPQTFHDSIGAVYGDSADYYRFTVTNGAPNVHIVMSGITSSVTIMPFQVPNIYVPGQDITYGYGVGQAGLTTDLVALAPGDYALRLGAAGNEATNYNLTLSSY